MSASVWTVTVLSFYYVCLVYCSWQDNLPPRRYVRLDPDTTTTFHGNHSGSDYFRILYKDDEYIIVGARDAAYNISLADLREVSKLSWVSNASTTELCRLKGKPEVECQNYIRVFVREGNGRLLVCGTNAFSPRCRIYLIKSDGYRLEKEEPEKPGDGICPHSPVHNSTSTYTDGELYVGTAADFSGQDALILRDRLRTDKWDTVALDDPDFVNSFALGDHVYFFFRETAVEYINCGKRVYSRVARVCKNDLGGPNRFKLTWTSYVKMRLNCSVRGDFPFYFDEIQATTEVVDSSYGGPKNQLIYGVFTTQPNAISGSAVCAFSLQNVLDGFAGPFKHRASLNSNWLPLPSSKVPEPRPGQCVNNSKTLPDMTLTFIKGHPLMDEAVGAFFGGPILSRVSMNYRFSAIAVDPRVRTAGVGDDDVHRFVDVIFVGTDNGRIIKAFNAHHKQAEPVVIEEIQAFSRKDAVRGLHISRVGEPKLVASSDSQLVMIPLHRCYTNKITICGECVALQDPYCAWDLRRKRCTYIGNQRYTGPEYVQNVREGVAVQCPGGVSSSGFSRDGKSLEPVFGAKQPLSFQSEADQRRGDRFLPPGYSDSGGHHSQGPARTETVADDMFTAETLAIAVAVTAIAALLIGFAAGHCCARRCHKDDVNLPYADTDYTYFDQRQNVNTRLTHDPNLLGEEGTYAEPVLIPTNSMVGTLKKNQTDTSIPLQYTDKYDGPTLPMRPGDKYGTHRQLRARPLPEDNGVGEDAVYRWDGAARREAPASDGYATTRSVRRVYL